MKVWEVIEKLSKAPAGAEVNVGIGPTMDVRVTEIEIKEEVALRSSDDVECCLDSGETEWLSRLVDDDTED